jgi:DNA modification methylase
MPMRDIHPRTPVSHLERDFLPDQLQATFDADLISALAGMSPTFVARVLGRPLKGGISLAEVLELLDQDAFGETFVPRSRIPAYLQSLQTNDDGVDNSSLDLKEPHQLVLGSAKDLIQRIPAQSVNCVVTSTPYWGTRLYEEHFDVNWADGEICALGNEQTPEGFIRHTVELLYLLKPGMVTDGSIWWNLMDVYNTRTQIRGNAAETLKAMNGQDSRGWKDHEGRRYSAGHAYLQDGEQCLIPTRVAERASRIGYWIKSTVIWKKHGSMPEPVDTRVTREVEYIIHMSLQRSPYFDKTAYLVLPIALGGRNPAGESEKMTDIWYLSTASGTDGHGAQFPVSLPARCIGVSTKEGELVLDPFAGSGTTCVAAKNLRRRSLGFDVSDHYLRIARRRVEGTSTQLKLLPHALPE